MDCNACSPRRPWELPFLAEPEAVAALRRLLRIHLGLWGLPELTDTVQLCVSELVGNVIAHVGPGTPATLAVSMRGTRLRIEVWDPDTRALPTLVDAIDEAESGRGMVLVAACSDRWGVQLLPEHKVTWVELTTTLASPNGHSKSVHVSRAERVVPLYDTSGAGSPGGASRLSVTTTDQLVIVAIADLLHWLRVHGRDADEALDRAQARFEAEGWQVTH
ncbi:ATP-binding protein [Streptomyces sp. L2]|uniref:ATP-binding protein n=1 Tax=Streptomyces sp. L2 TaxID=2162665 RepID=UPI0010106C6D|nr:ATP-binding protein [Streptomyces sp. L2]